MEDLEEEKSRTNSHGAGAIDMLPASSGSPVAVPRPPQASAPLSIPASPDTAALSAAEASASTTLPLGQARRDVEDNPADDLGGTDKDTLSGKGMHQYKYVGIFLLHKLICL